jgi:hypothetical protein
MIGHVAGWLLLALIDLTVLAFLGMNFADQDPEWTREKRVGVGIFLTGLVLLLTLFTVKTYPF